MWPKLAFSLLLATLAGASEPSFRGATALDSEPDVIKSVEPAEAEATGGSEVWPPWVEPGSCNLGQLLFLTVVYAYVLFTASGMISDGSELLLLVPSVAGLVGSVVLPILGAVPDGMMVLFSGLGPREVAQEQASVGVGALAGSTVMLLTFPWFIAIFAGSVPIKNGQADYKDKSGPLGLFNSGVAVEKQIKTTAKIMMATTVLYVIIQLPSTFEESRIPNSEPVKQAKGEGTWACIGLVASIFTFFAYIYYCYLQSIKDKDLEKVIQQIREGRISIAAAFHWACQKEKGDKLLAEDHKVMKKILKPFFQLYDFDKTGSVDAVELGALMRDLHGPPGRVRQMLEKHDKNKDNTLSMDEFTKSLIDYLSEEGSKKHVAARAAVQGAVELEADEEEEEEEVPEDLQGMSPEQQMRMVIFRAAYMMGLGTLLVLLFSDPMVDVLSEWGNRSGIPPFYISFVLAPFASNASELLAAYSYASKKTKGSITNSLSSLEGAACMNNTFCLAIFLALCYFQGLAWQFTAETIAIIFVQWLIGGIAMLNNYQTRFMACVVLACYPGCLALVYALENIVGLD